MPRAFLGRRGIFGLSGIGGVGVVPFRSGVYTETPSDLST
jgi:hypothetical protein